MTDQPRLDAAILARQPLAAAARQPARTNDPAQARSAAEEFEAVFVSQMLEHMFSGISTDGPFGGGESERIYRSLMINEYGRSIARAGGIGIAQQVMTEILRLQEGGPDAHS